MYIPKKCQFDLFSSFLKSIPFSSHRNVKKSKVHQEPKICLVSEFQESYVSFPEIEEEEQENNKSLEKSHG